jgi:phage baseplate assembly protein W
MNCKLPVDFSRLFESDIRNLPVQNEKDSIQQNLELIITTNPGEHKYDPQFGCKIWSIDFEQVVSRGMLEQQYLQFISEAVRKYEPRIYDIEVYVDFVDTKREDLLMNATYIKKKVNITMIAKLVNTGERCRFTCSLYLSPLNSN